MQLAKLERWILVMYNYLAMQLTSNLQQLYRCSYVAIYNEQLFTILIHIGTTGCTGDDVNTNNSKFYCSDILDSYVLAIQPPAQPLISDIKLYIRSEVTQLRRYKIRYMLLTYCKVSVLKNLKPIAIHLMSHWQLCSCVATQLMPIFYISNVLQ